MCQDKKQTGNRLDDLDTLTRIERFYRLLDLVHNKADMINGDVGFRFCEVRQRPRHGYTVTLDDVVLCEVPNMDLDALLTAYQLVKGARECVWALSRSGALPTCADVVSAA